MRLLLILSALFLFASPASAQYTPPDRDEDGCEKLAVRIDTAEQARQEPAGDDVDQLALCAIFFSCDAATAKAIPNEALKSNLSLMRYINQVCGLRA